MTNKSFPFTRAVGMYLAFLLTVFPTRLTLMLSVDYRSLNLQGGSYGLRVAAFDIPYLILIGLSFFSTAYLFLSHDTHYRETLPTVCTESKQGRIPTVCKSETWRMEARTLWAVALCLALLQVGDANTAFAHPVWVILILTAIPSVLYVALLLAHLSVRRSFRAPKKKKKLRMYGKAPFAEKHPIAMFWILLIRNVLLYAAAGYAFPFVLSAFLGLSVTLLRVPLPIYITIALISVFLAAFTYLRAILKRRAMLKKLKRVCEANEYVLSNVKHFYRSLFRSDDGYHFTVEKGRKRYDCKLISGRKRGVKISFHKDGTGNYIRSFSITGGSRSAAFVIRLPRAELFRIVTPFNYAFEAEGQKILIVNPVPRKIELRNEGQTWELGGGEHIGEYVFYNASGFLSALERNCVGK